MLLRVSLNGVDDAAGVAVASLWDEFPFAELGVAWKPRAFGTGSYATTDYIEDFANRFAGQRIALHVCHEAIGDFLRGRGPVSRIAACFPRIQLNFGEDHDYRQYDMPLIRDALARHADHVIITPRNASTNWLAELLSGVPNHEILFDASAGRGQLPSSWSAPLPGITCGYAGGLGPDNIAAELPRIDRAAAGQPYWIDMESRLREDGKFSISKARKVLEAAERFTQPQATI
jgi:hypothetical protein